MIWLQRCALAFAWLGLGWFAGAGGQAGFAAGNDAQKNDAQKLVVVLSSQEPTVPDVATLIKGFREGLTESRPTQFNIFVEDIDKSTPSGADDRTLLRLFAEKYGGRDPDLIIALGSEAIDFAVRTRRKMWSRVPIIFTSEARLAIQRLPGDNMTGVAAAMETDRTLHTALQLFPGTRRVALINGSSTIEKTMTKEFQRDIAIYGDRLELVDLSGQPLEEVRQKLANLDADTIAYFLSFRNDGTNRNFNPPEVLDVLAPVANRPIFGTSGSYFDHGIVGGWLVDSGQLGREAAVLAMRVFDGEAAAAVPLEFSTSIRPMFDWRQLQRWGVNEERLPAGSIVLFKQPTLWAQYKTWIMTAAGALMLQAALIAFLLAERTRRRHAEANALRLSGEVIAATETERTRIAQELHDDVSQRMALLSIEMDQFSGLPKTVDAGIAPQIKGLSGKVRDIAGDIYNIAKELHPATLKLLGLVSATRNFCTELESRHDIAISVDDDGDMRELSEPIAICLYRVIQEALQNAIKHSGAHLVSISFARNDRDVRVVVEDDGNGLAPVADRGGTGLFSMRERLRLVGGTFDMRSEPGNGTVIEAVIPNRAA